MGIFRDLTSVITRDFRSEMTEIDLSL